MKFVMNTVTARRLKILNRIEKNCFFTIKELSTELFISQRTIIKDIRELKIHFGNSASFISRNTGYYFREENRISYLKKKEDLLDDEMWFEIISEVFMGSHMNLNELADKYNYSESTMQRFATHVSEILSSYKIKLSLNPVNIYGEEGNIRKFFFDFFYESEHILFGDATLKSLYELVLRSVTEEKLKGQNFEMGTGMSAGAFFHHIYIAMVRSQNGHTILVPEKIKKLGFDKGKDFLTLLSLQPLIKKEYGVYLSKEEILWLHLVAVCQRTISFRNQEVLFYESYNQCTHIKLLISKYLLSLNVEDDKSVILTDFLSSFILSRKINECINPILNKLMTEELQIAKIIYKETYIHSLSFFSAHSHLISFPNEYFEDIIASFTLYYESLLNYYSSKKNIVFILEGDYLLIHNIRSQVNYIFGTKYNIRFLSLLDSSYYRLGKMEVDLIVSNYKPIVTKLGEMSNFILINRVPNQQDWINIKNKLN